MHKEAPFEIHSNPMFSADVLAALTNALDIWDYYIRLVVAACCNCVLVSPLFYVGFLLLCNAGLVKAHSGYLYLLNVMFQVIFFLLQ